MPKYTVNITKLSRDEIDTERLQHSAKMLISELYSRACEDLSITMEKSYSTDANEQKDRERRDSLRMIFDLINALPERGEKWRHNLA